YRGGAGAVRAPAALGQAVPHARQRGGAAFRAPARFSSPRRAAGSAPRVPQRVPRTPCARRVAVRRVSPRLCPEGPRGTLTPRDASTTGGNGMDHARFDALTRRVGTGLDRRAALRTGFGGIAATL